MVDHFPILGSHSLKRGSLFLVNDQLCDQIALGSFGLHFSIRASKIPHGSLCGCLPLFKISHGRS
jgi:hypothetical protein